MMPAASSNKILIVNQNHPHASNTNPASDDRPLKTIQAAAEMAFPGDTIRIASGVYRETVVPPRGGAPGQPITYQAAEGAQVFVRGSDHFTGKWRHRSGGVYAAAVPAAEGTENPFAQPLIQHYPRYIEVMKDAVPKRTLGQVFVDGHMLDEVDTAAQVEAMPGTWAAVEGGQMVLVHFPRWAANPEDHRVELTMRKAVFRPEQRGLGYITIRGLIFEHAANQPITYFWEKDYPKQQGLVSCRSGHHWVIEDNVIRYARSIGLDIGSEGGMEAFEDDPLYKFAGYHRIARNIISDNGQGGICGHGHIGTEILENVFERNNNLGAAAWEEAAIKTHFFIRGRIEGNLIRSNFCNGLWLDNVYQDIRVTRNVILGNQGAGIFCEMGGGPCLIDNNIIGLHTMGNNGIGGNGIYAHDAGGITIAHNFLFQNANYGIHIKYATERVYAVFPPDIQSFEQPAVEKRPAYLFDERIQNNILVDNHRGAINLPYPAEKAGRLFSDHNLFGSAESSPIFAVNTSAGAKAEDVLAAAGTPEPGPEGVGGPYLRSGEQFLLHLSAWQQWMGMDRQSATAEVKNLSWQLAHPGPGPWLTFQIDRLLACPPVPGVARDFYGAALPADHPMAGPFQNITEPGPYHFRLWPIAVKSG